MRIYLSSPYSHRDPAVMEARYKEAVKAAATLMQRGYIVFSPIAHSHAIGLECNTATDHEFWLRQDMPWLEKSDVLLILQLDGWATSRGVKEELEFAYNKGIPVLVAPASDIGDIDLDLSLVDPSEASVEVVDDVKDTNPKDAISTSKLPLSLVPATAIAYASIAHLNGALKYGAWNWRVAGVRASIYLDAAQRHITRWQNGEEFDEEGVAHLASALACLNILIDARECGKLTDDRPPSLDYGHTITALTAKVSDLRKIHAGRAPRNYTIADTYQEANGKVRAMTRDGRG